MPYRATVRTAQPALLETPRMLVPGYVAAVNGSSTGVIPTPEGFVGVPVPAGTSAVEVRFAGSSWLRIAFYTSGLAWLLLPAALWALQRRSVD